MKTTYIFGHRNPDTDSICASISLSYLKNELGFNTAPACLGDTNDETAFALNYFNIKKPVYLNDVKLQLSDVNYHTGFYIDENDSLYNSYLKMSEANISGIPVVDKNKNFKGMITLKQIAEYLINGNFLNLTTSYDNILETLEGKELLKFDDKISGNIRVATYRSTTIKENIKFSNKDILVIADRHSVIEYAIKSNIKMIILVGNSRIEDKHFEMAKKKKVNIIKTPLSGFFVTKRINLCSYNKSILKKEKPVFFYNSDYVNDFKEIALKIKHTNYPIVDSKNKCLGVLRMADIDSINRKKVILVDHNESSQSAVGIDEAEILEVIDHHKIGNISTKNPINFRNMSVGSTNTIIYELFKENHIPVTKSIAGIMLSGILSDTLILKSPTSTEIDKIAISELSKIAEVDYEKYGIEMYASGCNLANKTKEELFYTDYKTFDYNGSEIGISQISTLDIKGFNKKKKDIIKMLNQISLSNNLIICAIFVTDIIKNGSYIYYNAKSEKYLKEAFNLKTLSQGDFLENYISRKKQIVPKILDIL